MNEQQGLNITPHILPIHADQIIIHQKIGVKKDGKGVKKIGHLRFWFIDGLVKRVMADVVIDPNLADSFLELMKKQVEILKKEMKSDKLPNPQKPATTGSKEMTYIG